MGIFDSEEGVVCVVDVVRKFFKCKKKCVFNIYSFELEVFLEKEMILLYLNLKDFWDELMFKNVIVFIKRKV